jgi:hypothetical protein
MKTVLKGGAAGALAIVLAGGMVPAHAQWIVEASAGGVSYQSLSSDVSASSAMLGVRNDGPTWLYISSGLPLHADGMPWAAGGVGGRTIMAALERLDAGLEWGGHGHGYRAPETGDVGTGVVVEALPFVGFDAGLARFEVRSGVTHYQSSFAGTSISRTAHDSRLTAALDPHPLMRITGDARLLRADEDDYAYVGGTAQVDLPFGALWTYAGRWTSSALPDPAWGAGITVDAGPRYSVRAAIQQDATDPVFFNETRRFWSLGISARVGPTGRAAALADPVVPEMTRRGVVFRVPVSASADQPSVAGDFNGWTPQPMRRSGDEWTLTVRVEPGIYHYAFRSASGTWFLPDSVPNRKDDGFGGTNAVLVVPSRSE